MQSVLCFYCKVNLAFFVVDAQLERKGATHENENP